MQAEPNLSKSDISSNAHALSLDAINLLSDDSTWLITVQLLDGVII